VEEKRRARSILLAVRVSRPFAGVLAQDGQAVNRLPQAQGLLILKRSHCLLSRRRRRGHFIADAF